MAKQLHAPSQQNPKRRRRRRNPRKQNLGSATKTVLVIGAIALGVGVLWKAGWIGTAKARMSGAHRGGTTTTTPCAVYSFNKAQLQEPNNAAALNAWLTKWQFDQSMWTKPAKQSAIELMNGLYPECGPWTESTNATINHPDGTQVTWAQVMNQLGNQTFAQAGTEMNTLLFGEEPK